MNRQKIIRLSAAALILLSSINILSGCGQNAGPPDPADRVLSEPPTVTEPGQSTGIKCGGAGAGGRDRDDGTGIPADGQLRDMCAGQSGYLSDGP